MFTVSLNWFLVTFVVSRSNKQVLNTIKSGNMKNIKKHDVNYV